MALTHDELCQIACRFLQNNGFKVAFHDRFRAWTPYGEQADAIGFRNGASCLIEAKCSRSDLLADRKKPFRVEPEKGMGDWRFMISEPGIVNIEDLQPAGDCFTWSKVGLRRFTAGTETGSGLTGTASHFRPTNRRNAITCLARSVAWIFADTSKKFTTA